jgi:hypothetical protein
MATSTSSSMKTKKGVAKGTKREKPLAKPITTEQAVQIIELWDSHSIEEIAAKLGVNFFQVKSAGIDINKANPELCKSKPKRRKFDVSLAVKLFTEKKNTPHTT